MSIILDRVAFAYGSSLVLKDVSVDIPSSQIWALVGRSGVGKTTLLQMVAGVFAPCSGSISVDGVVVVRPGHIKGVVFQDDTLLGWLSAEQNLLFLNGHKNDAAARARARAWLTDVGLGGRGELLPKEMSAGMKKRLEFARALMNDDRYVLADEPFGTLDALTRRDLWRMWVQMRRSAKRTGIWCTHDPEEAIRLCDAVMILSSSRPSTIIKTLYVPESLKGVDVTHESAELLRVRAELLSWLAQ